MAMRRSSPIQLDLRTRRTVITRFLVPQQGGNNTGIGREALSNNTVGSDNTAVGRDALASNTTGSNNIALGVGAGVSHITGDDNIYIGTFGVNEAGTIRLGNSQTASFIAGITGVPVTGTPVVVSIFGQLGVAPSSQRFKEDIKSMDEASEALLRLKPVAFRYKKQIDSAEFGLLAEDVEKVNHDLVVHDKEGNPYSVRYDQVNAMLLNEFLKEHRKVEQQDRTIQEQSATIVELKKEMQAVIAHAKEQDLQIQRVRDQAQMKSPALQTIVHRQWQKRNEDCRDQHRISKKQSKAFAGLFAVCFHCHFRSFVRASQIIARRAQARLRAPKRHSAANFLAIWP